MCPGCGRIIGGRAWWTTTIAWGVVSSAVLSFILLGALYLILFFVFGPVFFFR
jgi:hypothetical protein